MDIEDRAKRWALDWYYGTERSDGPLTRDDLEEAYLAGACQAQADYSKYISQERRLNLGG